MPTGKTAWGGDTWDDYGALIMDGVTSPQAYTLMGQAAMDAIRKDPPQTLRLLAAKIREGLLPINTALDTYPLPGETYQAKAIETQYFDKDRVQIPALIQLQRAIYASLGVSYRTAYQAWMWICVLSLLLGLFRRPFFPWFVLAAMTGIKIFFPLVVAFGMWRYTVSGLTLLFIFPVAAAQTLGRSLVILFRRGSGQEDAARAVRAQPGSSME